MGSRVACLKLKMLPVGVLSYFTTPDITVGFSSIEKGFLLSRFHCMCRCYFLGHLARRKVPSQGLRSRDTVPTKKCFFSCFLLCRFCFPFRSFSSSAAAKSMIFVNLTCSQMSVVFRVDISLSTKNSSTMDFNVVSIFLEYIYSQNREKCFVYICC